MELGYKASKRIFAPSEYGKWKFCTEDDIRRIVGENDTSLKLSVMADSERTDYHEDILPRDILYREKHGFAFPISEYLREDLKDTAKNILFSGIHQLFNRNMLEKLFARHLERKQDLGQHIWALMVFNLWYEKNLQ